MFNGKLGKMISMVALALTLSIGLPGCITMPDGSSHPDYVMIEFGAVAAFTILVNETKVSDESVVTAYEGLSAMEAGLLAAPNGSDMDLSMIDAMLASAVPVEYKALASTASKLIRSRVRQYMDVKLPSNPITESEVTIKTTLAVVQGAKSALGPKYTAITK